MGAPTAQAWGSRPGGLDALHMEQRYPGEGRYGIPIIAGARQVQPERLCPWAGRKGVDGGDLIDGAWHFYADDYRFEALWKRPDQYDQQVERAAAVLTPDFSVYRDWPWAAQLWNTYRSRWVGARGEARGRVVVPTVNWGTWESYDFAFAGVARGATVSVSTVGTREPDAQRLFRSGYEAMVEAIQPSLVLVYGERWDDALDGLVPVARYSPKGVLEMRARLEGAVDRRQMRLFEEEGPCR